ncbi:LuxR C-terminal-related transcriptional regulator [Rhodococcus sp. Z13]|uniref:LuxR C-terminal-related transcriptional regulator n=1 Tax=Rhodococcus sacchari TaxID=2962047 RepID=A0ACD4DFT4_9NOCA|nr:LuxR C-terminal-related transcriptional regulator [Rhodococcus sp. Z13]UYP18944.1 LuxR C-terminal-related transcriptional regulator [Rhodococcus sp. Z13]
MNARPDHSPFRPTRPNDLVRPLLSAREKEVLLAWLGAESKGEAARRLFISVGTLNTHLQRIRVKYASAGRDAPTKASLLARALQDGLTTLEEW